MTNLINDGLSVAKDLEILGDINSLALLRLHDMADVVSLMAAEMARLAKGERWVLLASTRQLGLEVLHHLCPWANPDSDVIVVVPGHTPVLRGMRLHPWQVHERMDPDLPWFTDDELSFIDSRIIK